MKSTIHSLLALALLSGTAVAAEPIRQIDSLLELDGRGTVLHQSAPGDRIAKSTELSPLIDGWAEGTITEIAGDRITISGVGLPFASQYSQMRKEIFGSTKDLEGEALKAKVQSMQRQWQDKVSSQPALVPDSTPIDMSFIMPKNFTLTQLDESGTVVVAAETEAKPMGNSLGAPVTEASQVTPVAPMFGTLKVGSHIKIGFGEGPEHKHAFAAFECKK